MTLGRMPAARAQAPVQGRRWALQTVLGSPAALKSIVFDPFDASMGCTSIQVPLASTAAFARMRAEAAAPQLNLYIYTGRQELTATDENLLADLGPIPGLDSVPANLRTSTWVAFGLIAEGILYRTDKLTTPPRGYKDLLRPEYQGHVALATPNISYGADALVMMARAFGGDERNIDPGFRAMAQLAQTATLFKVSAEVNTLFAQEDIWAIPYDATAAIRCQQAGLPVALAVPEEGSPGVPCVLCIPKNAPDEDIAKAAIARFLSVDTQKQFAEQLHWTPTNSQIELPDALQRQLPKLNEFVLIDQRYVNEQLPAWLDRWNREVAR